MPRSQRRTALAALLLVLASPIGCDKPPPKPVQVPVTGTVTLDGVPLADGTVYFKTIATGAFDTFAVKGGKFEGSAEVGERRVEISSYKTRPLKDNPMGGEAVENVVPPRYNAESTLSATVTADGPNAFKFELTSAK